MSQALLLGRPLKSIQYSNSSNHLSAGVGLQGSDYNIRGAQNLRSDRSPEKYRALDFFAGRDQLNRLASDRDQPDYMRRKEERLVGGPPFAVDSSYNKNMLGRDRNGKYGAPDENRSYMFGGNQYGNNSGEVKSVLGKLSAITNSPPKNPSIQQRDNNSYQPKDLLLGLSRDPQRDEDRKSQLQNDYKAMLQQQINEKKNRQQKEVEERRLQDQKDEERFQKYWANPSQDSRNNLDEPPQQKPKIAAIQDYAYNNPTNPYDRRQSDPKMKPQYQPQPQQSLDLLPKINTYSTMNALNTYNHEQERPPVYIFSALPTFPINSDIDNLRNEIFSSQKVFMNHLTDLKREVERTNNARVQAEKNLLVLGQKQSYSKYSIEASADVLDNFIHRYNIQRETEPPKQYKSATLRNAVNRQRSVQSMYDEGPDLGQNAYAGKMLGVREEFVTIPKREDFDAPIRASGKYNFDKEPVQPYQAKPKKGILPKPFAAEDEDKPLETETKLQSLEDDRTELTPINPMQQFVDADLSQELKSEFVEIPKKEVVNRVASAIPSKTEFIEPTPIPHVEEKNETPVQEKKLPSLTFEPVNLEDDGNKSPTVQLANHTSVFVTAQNADLMTYMQMAEQKPIELEEPLEKPSEREKEYMPGREGFVGNLVGDQKKVDTKKRELKRKLEDQPPEKLDEKIHSTFEENDQLIERQKRDMKIVK